MAMRWMLAGVVCVAIGASGAAMAADSSGARNGPPEGETGTDAASARGPSYADRRFENFVTRYFKGYFDFRPGLASDIGFHDRDRRMPDYSRGALGREANRLRAAYAEVNSINPEKLDRDNAIDRRLLLASIQAELLDLIDIRPWQHQPAFYNDAVASAIFTLVKRNFAPPEERLRSVVARERQIPAVLRAARENLENPPRLWVELALDDTQGTADFLQKDVPAAFAGVGDERLQADFADSTRQAVSAVDDYLAWLRSWLLPRANGEFRLGEPLFRKKLRFEEMVDTPIAQLLDQGFAELERQQAHFKETAAQIEPGADPLEVLHKLTSEHDKPEELIAKTQALLVGLRDFLVEKQIVDLPSMTLPIVAETPPFARAFTFASMDTPGAFEDKAHEAYFYLTLPDPSWTPERIEDHMTAYWQGDLVNTAIHEAYPGHYVQFLWLPYSPSFTRKILGANTFIEGWAHYTEEMLLQEGYGNNDPKLWLSAEQWALVRVCRYLVGILMHTRGMTLEDGVAFFEKNAYLSHANAVREAQRGTADPTYLYYTLGKLQIQQLRKDVEAIEGPKFSLRRFHDRLLSQGFPPLAIVRDAMGVAMEADEDQDEPVTGAAGLLQAPVRDVVPEAKDTGH